MVEAYGVISIDLRFDNYFFQSVVEYMHVMCVNVAVK